MEKDTISIRLATATDLSDIQLCAIAAYSRYLSRMGREPAPMRADFPTQIGRQQVYLATYTQVFAGYIVFYSMHQHLQIENVAVLPELSGKGIGKCLLEFAEQQGRACGLTSAKLYTNVAMTENLSIYPAMGYKESAREVQDGFHRVFFRKNL